MRVLRLADQKTAAMDKLHYFNSQADIIMPRHLTEAEYHAKHLLTDGIKEVLAEKTDLASVGVAEEEEDGSNESEAEESSDKVMMIVKMTTW